MPRSILIVVGLVLLGLIVWRISDNLADRRMEARLRAMAPADPPRFDPAMIAHLPEPARRYLSAAIAPGTALTPVAAFDMSGTFRLGTAEAPRPMQMQARQIHAPPHGFLWKMHAGAGVMRVSGSDSAEWTRFWAMGLIPVARVGDTPDHRRAALGRLFIETVWTPAAFLAPDVRWDAPGPDVARAIFTHDGQTYAIDLSLDASGQPQSGVIERWSDANPGGQFQLQPFGGTLGAYETHDGFTIPMQAEVGNFFGTPDYFPFFTARLAGITFVTGD